VSCQSSAIKNTNAVPRTMHRHPKTKIGPCPAPSLCRVTAARWSGRMSIPHAKIVVQTDTLSHAHVSAKGVLFVCVHPHLHQHPRKQQTSPSPPNTRSPKPNATNNSRLFLSWESPRHVHTNCFALSSLLYVPHPCI
jgi:hypothetical protein